jgi:hypothetical protein
MAATIRIGDTEATIDGYEWSSDDKTLEKLLNLMLDPFGPSGADPNPDVTAARRIAARVGGEVIRQDAPRRSPRAPLPNGRHACT